MPTTTKDVARGREWEKEEKEENILDFGFSTTNALDMNEVDYAPIRTTQKLKEQLEFITKILYTLLDNLAIHPENVYIKWPNRLERIKTIKDQITKKLNEK